MQNNSYPSLLDLPSKLIHYIMKMLPQSPYYKSLNVCKHLDTIENEYIIERKRMCLCRVSEHSPNLPSEELDLLLCTNFKEHNMDIFINMIKRRIPTCKTKIIGSQYEWNRFENYIKTHTDHPNIQTFLKNLETNSLLPIGSYIPIGLNDDTNYNLDQAQTRLYTNCQLQLSDNQNSIKEFCHLLPGFCFDRIHVYGTSNQWITFIQYLKNECHMFDVLNFQEKVTSIGLDHYSSMLFRTDSLDGFHNLECFYFHMRDMNFETLINTLLQLIQLFRQSNLKKLHDLTLTQSSPLRYNNYLTSLWIDLFNALPSETISSLSITSETNRDSIENLLKTYYESSNCLTQSITRFRNLEILMIHHLSFDHTVIEILPFFQRLKILHLHIHMNYSNINTIDDLYKPLEQCNQLEEFVFYISEETTMTLTNMCMSLEKLQHFQKLSLYFNSFEQILSNNWYEKLHLIKNLQYISLNIKNTSNSNYILSINLCEKLKIFVKKNCQISISGYD